MYAISKAVRLEITTKWSVFLGLNSTHFKVFSFLNAFFYAGLYWDINIMGIENSAKRRLTQNFYYDSLCAKIFKMLITSLFEKIWVLN